MITSAYALTTTDWAQAFCEKGISSSALPFWINGLYKDATFWDRHIAPNHLQELKQSFHFDLPTIARIQESEDGTVKFQMRFKDHLEVETVLIPFFKRFTICLSTQVGCAMNCSFCYTGTQGLKRNLEAGEIVGQYLSAFNWLLQKDARALKPSVVFMGQGEPLHNFIAVKRAVEVLNDPKLIGVGHRQMTLSTVGYLPNIHELKNFPRINIALSLHSPFDQQRNELIPINQRFPLDQVLTALDELPLLARQFITFEYLLIKNFNMSDEHAEELALKLGSRKALINLIPFNPFPGSAWERPSVEEIEEFKEKLVAHKLRVMVRNTKGDDILAACGQLKIKEMARNYGQ
jgi:23S rRNA (adenine2503-C2)-methyltransferase